MILGVFINGFKSYAQTAYIHLSKSDLYKFTTIVGKNGTGKSAILEALNFFFKQGSWNINRSSKNKEDLFISPVFLIEKSSLEKWLESSDFKSKVGDIKSGLEQVSKYLWDEANDTFKGATRRAHIKEFFNQSEMIRANYIETHYLLVIGKNVDAKSISKPFSNIDKNLGTITLDQINNVIENYYNYIYIPVEQQANSTLRIENMQMQKIMNQNVILKIEQLLKEKMSVDDKYQSLIEHINGQLSHFIEDINKVIKTVNPDYEFRALRNKRRNLTPSDIVDNILDGYFSKRTLKSSHKEIEDLSSGEQRRALIDIVYAFLTNRGKEDEAKGRNVILAIDEPEVSQDLSHCFEQFERLEKLSNMYGNQVLVTTHWYGVLPVIENGTLLHLAETEESSYHGKFSIFDFYNYLDSQEYFPDEIKLKSVYDLAVSLSAYIRKESSKHLILCEGGTDKRYLETLIDTDKVRILPVGGVNNVRNIYNLLVMPLKIDRRANSIRKVLCLTDTDPSITNNSDLGKDPSGKIQLKRLQINHNKNRVDLISLDNYNPSTAYTVTRIEDVLDSKIYKKAIGIIIEENKQEYGHILFDDYELVGDSNFTNLLGDSKFLFCKTLKSLEAKSEFISFVESKKTQISFKYLEEFNRAALIEPFTVPSVFISINDFFSEDVIRATPEVLTEI
ncbi:AAA family ATPase [Paenibacillus cucumis (ex Kampfer et al. 2016)]|uniref:AAA family ATPase n=1 Tax=Paenibacillus cucumis (ex Kampfer et al. 2016) TaxID=1776858 RepID=A0ABS7KF12_9BACL|nr:AAA family ATPase [Paenibacillus cucumis (ex Kampfer et al. 2016)]MBY0202734.1 AAA family ATPase [Paenibacillus cucumis (ex Kampfer et al. 2016)]